MWSQQYVRPQRSLAALKPDWRIQQVKCTNDKLVFLIRDAMRARDDLSYLGFLASTT